MSTQIESKVRGDAHGDDVRYHSINDGAFRCTAPDDAPCRTSPTCECENWCCCDGSPEDAVDNHGEGGHCCMTTTRSGQGCWLKPWVDAAGHEDCYSGKVNWPQRRMWDELGWPDGAVICDWADGVFWDYATQDGPR